MSVRLLLDRLPHSDEGRLVLIAVVIEAIAIASSILIAQAFFVESDARVLLFLFLMWTVPVSVWIGIRAPFVMVDRSVFASMSPALAVGLIATAGLLVAGVIVGTFGCGVSFGFGDGAPEAPEPECAGGSPIVALVAAALVGIITMVSIVFGSALVGYPISKIRDFLERSA